MSRRLAGVRLPGWLRRVRKPVAIGCGILAGILALVLAILWLLLRGSLAQTHGTVDLPGLGGAVTVTRDAHGVPTIVAKDELDAWRALGFVEAQDRFPQMDFLRRAAAGDLSALVGPAALELDRRRAVFDLRRRARRIYLDASPPERARLEAFALGVNDGLRHLAVRPWPYLLFGQRPAPWRPEDSVLAIYAMGFELQDPYGRRQRSLAALESVYPAPVVAFLMAQDTDWAAPMAGSAPTPPPIPGTRDINFAAAPAPAGVQPRVAPPPPASGSNGFAVAGRFSASGAALLANDMHLGLNVPPVWYRARVEFPAAGLSHGMLSLTGVFLPGVPALVAGTNGHVAWGLTNSEGDWVDLIAVPPPATRTSPAVAATVPLATRSERIAVHGGKPVSLRVTRTPWGPVIGKRADGALLVSHWTLAQPGGINLEFSELEHAQNVSQALDIASRSGIPAQNFVVADRGGNIGWTIAGRIPARRPGCRYDVPRAWAGTNCGWDGWLQPDAYPRIVDPADGYIVTANNHVDETAAGDLIGDGGYADGARAHQIAGDLAALTARGDVTPRDLLAVQLDDRAKFLARWRDLVLAVLRPSALQYHPKRRAFRTAVIDWGGRAAVASVGYRLVRAFRDEVADETFAPVLTRIRSRYKNAELPFASRMEGPLWRLVVARPPNWLNPKYPTWNALFLNAIDAVAERLWKPGAGLREATWGRRNTVHVDNPIAGALGPLGTWLNMPVRELPGDRNMPRVQAPRFGASMRMDVAPGDVVHGVFELPGGESGHPLSPWYKDEYRAWAEGRAEPLAPGPAIAHMRLVPPPLPPTRPPDGATGG